MHFRTHVKDEMRTKADELAGRHMDEYQAGMIEHDLHIGEFLALLDELGIADETVVFYSTDNGPHMNTWPDAAMTPFRGEKNTNWEGGFRVPAMVRWPGNIEAGRVSNAIMHHMDWLPTFLAMAGNDTVKEDLLEGVSVAEVGGGPALHAGWPLAMPAAASCRVVVAGHGYIVCEGGRGCTWRVMPG